MYKFRRRSNSSNPNKVALWGGTLAAFEQFRMPLVNILLERGFEVHCLYYGSKKPPNNRAGLYWHSLGSSAHSRGAISNLSALMSAIGLLLVLQPKALLSFNAKPIVFGSLLARIFAPKCRRIVLMEGLGKGLAWLQDTQSLRAKILVAIFLRHGENWFFLNQENQRIMGKLIGGDFALRSHILRGVGVNLQEFSAIEPQNLWQNKRAVFVGRLVEKKGLRHFIAIARASKLAGLDWRFAVAGMWAEDSDVSNKELKQWIEEGVIEKAQTETDMAAFYSEASVLVFPSEYEEGFPAAIMEAQARGLPCLVAKREILRDVILTNISGYYCDLANKKEWVEKLQCLEDAKQFNRISNAAARYAHRVFDEKLSNEGIARQLMPLPTKPPQRRLAWSHKTSN